MKIQFSKLDFFNFTPLFVLFWCLFSFAFLPILPIASGYGWDGIFYGNVVMDFGKMIGNIDSYHANRIFPAVLIHYVLKALQTPMNLENALLAYRVYNIIILVVSAMFWVSIARKLALDSYKKWIGFIALFVNYPLMNLHFYYPALTDGTAFLIGLIMFYSYLTKNNILLLTVTFITYFCWPASIIVGFILFVFSNAESVSYFYKEKRTSVFIFILLLSPFLAFISFQFAGSIKEFVVLFNLPRRILRWYESINSYEHLNYVHLINAICNAASIVFLFWYMLMNFDIVKFIRNSARKQYIVKFLISFFILIFLVVIKKYIYSSILPTLSPFEYFSYYFAGVNVRFPLQFLVYQISYWGPIMILFMLFFKEIMLQLTKMELPYLLIVLYTILFVTNSEGRPIISFYPFIVVIILNSINFEKVKNKKLLIVSFVLVSFIYSKVWLPIHLPTTIFPESIWTNLDKFPMQWYFMNFGLFTNLQMYLVHVSLVILFFLLFYLTIKKSSSFNNKFLNSDNK
jgi:hypothetical protein